MKFQKANIKDLDSIVKLLADDKLGSQREFYQIPLPDFYVEAFEKITKDENQELIVLKDEDEKVIGTMQLTFIQYLTYRGGVRMQIEAVRIDKKNRGEGLGEKMFIWAIERAKERKAHVVQLTTDKQRPDALRFYEKLGFKASHEGMKLHL
ncbi:GNAT family N-acetyltransferase [Chondrinema litorale]|uniref:GNAT family N-acetyltransferase n=1 Tax=Chondrinema litorale TaxID=2994555 RepID=UPI002542E45A|nr:GNAT family N-acetyltransferase [Chondrinema litorale]UZR97257.1 GNAT family N-acetyltransferase [Chondrinema litorale]